MAAVRLTDEVEPIDRRYIMTLGERIKHIRKEARLTQAEFGTRIGITFSSVSLLEVGKNTPSEQTIRAICSEFSVNRDWLVDGIGEMKASLPLIPELLNTLRKYPHVLEVLAAMEADDWRALNDLIERVFEEKQKKDG